MSEAAEKILCQLLELSETDQLDVAQALNERLESLVPCDATLLAELEVRRKRHEAGDAPGVPAREVFHRLRTKDA